MSLVLVAGVGAGAWVGIHALSAKKSLESAQVLIGDLQTKVTKRDFAGAKTDATQIQKDTAKAVSLTSDPIWRTAELVPVLGQNLTVVRKLADVVNNVAAGAIDPAVTFASSFDLKALKPVNGHINLAPISAASGVITEADDAIKTAAARVKSIDDSSSIGQVKAAKIKLESLLAKAQGITTPVRNAVQLLPPMLGADGKRTYIMIFMNNAEATSLGGAASAWSILNVDNGAITLGAQPGSQDFPRDLPIPPSVPASVVKLFAQNGLQHPNNVGLRPDFPTAAKLTQAFWLQKSGQKVDGVLSFDPVALSYLLNATGPVALQTGETLDSSNAVKFLLSDVYAKYPNPAVQNVVFADAAASIFHALTSSKPDVNKLVAALGQAVTESRLMVWSDHPAEQSVLSAISLGGILDTTNSVNTQIGVFFNENSASKMAYYLKTSAALTTTACQSPDKPVFTAVVSLNSDITSAAEKALPAYVRSQVYLKPVKTRTQVYVYGPPGASYATFADGGGALKTTMVGSATDLGRPVAHIAMDLLAGQTGKFTVTFSGTTGGYGPLSARVTPMVNPTAVTLNSPGCAVPSK